MQKGNMRAFVYIEQYLKLLKDNKAHLRATLNQIESLLKQTKKRCDYMLYLVDKVREKGKATLSYKTLLPSS